MKGVRSCNKLRGGRKTWMGYPRWRVFPWWYIHLDDHSLLYSIHDVTCSKYSLPRLDWLVYLRQRQTQSLLDIRKLDVLLNHH